MLAWGPITRLACILAGVGLATTRLTLIAHELVGHGGAAIAGGGRVIHVELFWFAGGWIRYELPADAGLAMHLFATLGGIGLQIVVGLALWLALARRTSLRARVIRASGAAIAMHGGIYLSAGTYHGYGDGRLVRWALGDDRYIVVIASAAFVLLLAYASARSILGLLAGTIPGTRRARIAGTIIALALAGVLQGGLVLAELSLASQEDYGTIMQPMRETLVEHELAKWEHDRRARGLEIDEADRSAREAALREAHRELPYQWIFGVLIALAIAAGWVRSAPGGLDEIPRRFVWSSVIAAVASIALVIAIDAAFA